MANDRTATLPVEGDLWENLAVLLAAAGLGDRLTWEDVVFHVRESADGEAFIALDRPSAPSSFAVGVTIDLGKYRSFARVDLSQAWVNSIVATSIEIQGNPV